MNQNSFTTLIASFSSPLIKLSILTFFLLLKNSLCVDPQFLACVPKTCGVGGPNISYPFWIQGQQQAYCGYPGFQLSCNEHGHPLLKLSNNDYIIHQIFYNNQSLLVSNALLSNTNSGCAPSIQNVTLEGDPFEFGPDVANLFLLFNCSSSIPTILLPYKINDCSGDNGTGSALALFSEDPNLGYASGVCRTGVVAAPVEVYEGDGMSSDIEEVLRRGFVLQWRVGNCGACEESGGRCGFNETTYHFKCFCSDRPHAWLCPARTTRNRVLKVAIGTSAAGLVFIMVLFCCFRRRFSSDKSMVFWKKEANNYQNIEAVLRNNGSLAPKRYNYSDIKKMTNSFKDKLGQGGYGGVYKGKLHDGHLVAVKILSKSKGNGEEFVNEVASISRTSHINIVSLLGFCFEGNKRALIYEFMPNGSLEKFIYEENALKTRKLGWETLSQIAVGIARGLEYLHRGCNTRILHFDIKPHNILLDKDFCPKISDFGLAKLCPGKESIISMLGARGTAGYIAPEVFCRNFGGVSHKSDVYSYGMMVLEMVGGRKNIDVAVDHTSEIYFPHWIYKRLELDEELGLHDITNEDEKESARKMIIVGLWCIQTDPLNRPSMSRVVDMLEGSLESLQIPPRPFLSSPSRSPADSSTTQIT